MVCEKGRKIAFSLVISSGDIIQPNILYLQVIVATHQGAIEGLVHLGGEDLIKALAIKKDLVIHKEDLEIQVDLIKVLETMLGPQKGLAIQVVHKKGLGILMDL